jgi:TfoX/Sxy family transcriptional regulator of competence genes
MTTMKMPSPSEATKELFRSLLPEAPGVTERPMFGQLAGFVNGNMFMSLFGDRIAIKLPDEQLAELMKVKGAEEFAPMAGRPMRGYALIPKAWHVKPEQAGPWIDRSLEYVGSLPSKAKKATGTKKKGRST